MILLVSLAMAECPPVAGPLEAATVDLASGRSAAANLAAAESAFACERAEPSDLARFLLVTGAAKFLDGDRSAADPYFAAAALADPAYFDDRLGPEIRSAWTSAKLGDAGRITVNKPVYVDGKSVRKFPRTVDSGPHLLQSPPDGWAKLVYVPPSEDINVEVPAGSAASATARSRHSPGWLIVAGVAAAGAGGCAYGATTQDAVMEGAVTGDEVESAYGLQRGLAYSAAGLGLVAVTSGVFYFVF
ncbi:MAG: hypothetical protein FJ102_19565 [Deltaproteobacteria bacterium]|nr:hypothetical protein [Deltaproteobacteria bacterium]